MILTPRQTEIAKLLRDGHAPKQIARELGISEHTVGMHIKLAKAKLEASGLSGRPTTMLAVYYERHHQSPAA